MVGTIDEAAPHDDAAEGLQCICQHVGTVGMRAVIVARTGLSLTVGFDQKAAEVGNELVYFLCLTLPPLSYRTIQGVGSLGVTQSHRGGEVDAEEDLDAIGTQDIGYLLHLFQIGCGEHFRRSIDIVQHGTVDAQ